MTITEAQHYIKSLITDDTKKSHVKTYNRFLSVLDFIIGREFNAEDIETIETHLDTLDLKAEAKNKNRYIFKKYSALTAFLKKEYNLITEGYYTSIATGTGIALGMSLGMSFGVAFNRESGLVNGMIFGMLIGLIAGAAFGTIKDKEAKKAGNVIPKTQL